MNRLKFFLLSFLVVGMAAAQDLSKLTPEQIEMYKRMAGGKLPSVATQQQEIPNQSVNSTRVVELPDSTAQDNKEDKRVVIAKEKLKVFGSYLFDTKNLTFEPTKLNIPTPVNYVLGVNDEVLVDISGLYEANYKLKVSAEGTLRIPNIGPIKVSGLTIEAATRSIRNQVSRVYMGVGSGETKVNIALGNIRSIRVNVIGEAVRPGSYNLPSLATAFNALYACGGPNEIGTMRNVQVIRAGKVIARLDLYKYLLDGVLLNNVVLQDEDVVKIDPYKVRVIINGAVKRAAIFEGAQGEPLQKLIAYAGGFSDNAFKDKLTAYRLTGKEKTVVDITADQLSGFQLMTGDSIYVSSILNRFDNRVDIQGAVFRPGAYALEQGLTLRKLVAKADGVKEDAYLPMAFISRKMENRLPQIIGFNLGKVLNGESPDIFLRKDDNVEIRSILEMREMEEVSINGAVKSPGKFSLVENMTLKDLIYKAKGFTEMAATDSIELVRPVKDQDSLILTNQKSLVYKFAMDKDMNFKMGSGNITLQNGDQIIVRNITGYEGVRMVRVEGEVMQPGNYNITNKAERISDVIKRAGGLTNFAYAPGAFLLRSENLNEIEKKLNRIMIENSKNQLENQKNKSLDANMLRASNATSVQGYTAMDSIQKKLSGSNVVEKIASTEGVVGLNLKEIMSHPNSKFNLKLEEGDIIYVPTELQTVKVVGQVLFPTIVRYDKKMNLKDYINNAGGFALNSDKAKVFVLYPNGSAKSTERFLGIKIYPKVTPGARVVVPEMPGEIKNKLTPAETVAILTSITTAISLMYSILISK